MKIRLLLALLACAFLIDSAPASATLFCEVKKTKDGFVALRAAPSPEARLLARMTADGEVMLGEAIKGDWIEVFWWRGDDRLKRGGPGLRGWAHRALVDMCG